jgi:hypothetical protein
MLDQGKEKWKSNFAGIRTQAKKKKWNGRLSRVAERKAGKS